jgi:lysophospholipase L1-like esterase
VRLGSKICIQSPDKSYPALLDDKGRIDLQANATCPGATTTDVGAILDSPQNPLNPQIRLVTLTVGGADLNFSDVLTTCTLDATACTGAVDDALSLLPDLKSDLTNLYTEIAAAAPEARIVVTGYPLLFEPPPSEFSADVINAVNNGGVALNKTIEAAVAEANEDGNIDYVDVTEEFQKHGVLLRVNNPDDPDDPNAFIHSPFIICDPTTDLECKDPGDPAAYHPTDDGYVAYADAISAALPRGWLNKQEVLA